MATTQLDALREQFIAASTRWPNLKSILVTWPESGRKPTDAELATAQVYCQGIPFRRSDDGTLVGKALAIGGMALDTPQHRYVPGCAALLILEWQFPTPLFGNPRCIHDPNQANACCERLRVLSDCGEQLLRADWPRGLREISWHSRTFWRLAVHSTATPRRVALPDRAECEILDDLFLASAEAIDLWKMPAGEPVSVSVQANEITVDGTRFTGLPHQCLVVQALLDAKGLYVTGPELSELPGCSGKKWSREFDHLVEDVPPIKRYLIRGDPRGYRIAFPKTVPDCP